MNLPHLPPVRFAQHVIKIENSKARVECEFPSIPSLPMFIEAAAQSSAALAKNPKALIGFLATCKDIKLHSKHTSISCIMEVQEHFNSPTFGEYNFRALCHEGILLASGSLVIFHPNE